LLIFLALLPMICSAVAGLQGHASLGQQSRDAFGRLFLFQFIWVFLGVTLASTALSLTDSISEYASEPALVLQVRVRVGARLGGRMWLGLGLRFG